MDALGNPIFIPAGDAQAKLFQLSSTFSF